MPIHSYLLDNEMLLYSEARQAIYRLNPSASFLWCCYEEGLSEEQMVAELVGAFPIDAAQAKRDLAATLGEWRQLGLLCEVSGFQDVDDGDTGDNGENTGEALIDADSISMVSEGGVRRYYRILGQSVDIQYPDEALLKLAGIALDSLLTDTVAPDQHHFTVTRAENGFAIMYGEQLVEHCHTAEVLAPLVLAQVVSASTWIHRACWGYTRPQSVSMGSVL